MITIRRIAGGCVELIEPAGLDAALREDDGLVWIDLVGRDGQNEALLRRLGLEDLEIEDLLETAIHPKAEVGDGHLLIVLHGLDLDYAGEQDEFQIETIELDGVVGPNWVVTHANRALEVTRQVATLVERDPSVVATPCALFHRMLDTIVDEYEPFVEQFIPERIDAIEDELFDRYPSGLVRREIYLRRRDVMRIQRVAVPQATAMRELVRLATTSAFACHEAALFRDIADRLDRVASLSTTLRAELDSAFEHYFSAVATNQNEVMKVLTMVSAILLPLTVVTGIYGMNFVHMPELDEQWAYPAVLALNVTIIVVGLLFFRARGWIGRRRVEPYRGRREIPVLGRALRLPALGARAVGIVSRRAARLAFLTPARYHRAERRGTAAR
jgi:magnesium transporter